MEHFHYIDYKEFIIFLINNGRGRGEFARIAEALQVSTVLISQIFKGHKDLTFEQGIKLTNYFGFNELETKYFMSTLSFNKAGNQDLKKFYKHEMEQIRAKSIEISSIVINRKTLTDAQKSVYYSDWTYAACHLSCALPFIKNENDLSLYLGLPADIVDKVTSYLIECELIKKVSGEFQIGATHIHLDKKSHFIQNHHRNWRMLTSLRSSNIQDYEIMYTSPMVISKQLGIEIQKKLLQTISDLGKMIDGCPDEETWVFNLDFIQLKNQRF